eukprot:SM000070S21372  [mRNA]  locus=s70:601200:606261:- [translate_table: standard]
MAYLGDLVTVGMPRAAARALASSTMRPNSEPARRLCWVRPLLAAWVWSGLPGALPPRPREAVAAPSFCRSCLGARACNEDDTAVEADERAQAVEEPPQVRLAMAASAADSAAELQKPVGEVDAQRLVPASRGGVSGIMAMLACAGPHDVELDQSFVVVMPCHAGPKHGRGLGENEAESEAGRGGGGRYGELKDVVSFSSQTIAAYRAAESERPDALFRDPLAAPLAGPVALARQRARAAAGSNPARFALRTKWIDDALLEALQAFEGLCRQVDDVQAPRRCQVVILGCGMDARAWRLPSIPAGNNPKPPANVLFMVDKPNVLKEKARILSQLQESGKLPPITLAEERIAVPVSVGTDRWQGKLRERGFDSSAWTTWVLEGLLMYLQPESVSKLISGISSMSTSTSRLIATGISAAVLERSSESKSELVRSWKWGCDDPEGYFREYNWKLEKMSSPREASEIYGRELGPREPASTTSGSPPCETRRTWYIDCSKEAMGANKGELKSYAATMRAVPRAMA